MAVNPDKIVKWLSDMLRADPMGVNEMLRARIPCSARLGDVPGVNVVIDERSNTSTSLLEVLGGLYPSHSVEAVRNLDGRVVDIRVHRDHNRRTKK